MLLSLTDEKSVNVGTPGIYPEEIVVPPFTELRAITTTAMNEGLTKRVRQYLATMRFDTHQYKPTAEEIAAEHLISAAETRQVRLKFAEQLRSNVTSLRY
jgi:DNA-directed RNA polymerase sigma subunit (sigma70/sigma32)